MKFKIEHEIKGRMRIHLFQKKMTFEEADIVQYYFENLPNVVSAKVYERSCNVVINYTGDRMTLIDQIRHFRYDVVDVPESYLENSDREVNRQYWDKLVNSVIVYGAKKMFLPYPVRAVLTTFSSMKYMKEGIKTLSERKIEVPVLDGLAIGISVFRCDFETASSVMFLLGVGETLEEWTHKKSVGDLARSMALNVNKVWLRKEGQQELVFVEQVREGDEIIVHMGNMIPFDGEIVAGEAMVNQSTLTGESVPVLKQSGKYVYAGTVVEDGELVIRVQKAKGGTKYEKIVKMIEDTEKLKSSVESKAEHLADKLVPYTLAGTLLTYLLTRNVTKALSVLMVDFSCALKLAMPLTVLSAIREANQYNITVKGGKFLEAIAAADTIVFDKTGTLTKAHPVVVDVIPFVDEEPEELLKIAACMEEHFPHPMAKAVVRAAEERNLLHEERHSKVNYVVAHGISTTIDGKRAVIGSYHFVFDDEKCIIPEDKVDEFENLVSEYSHLFLCLDGKLAAVLQIEDPIRKEAAVVIEQLRQEGFKKIVMMTGDSMYVAKSVANKVGVDECYYEVLPENKAKFVEEEKKAGKTVVMIGDGVNDSPALSAADAGIAIRDGAAIAKEIADVTISGDNLYGLVTLKKISNLLMKRIDKNYKQIVGINGALIGLGVAGIVQPTFSALCHNTSTLVIGLGSMKNLIQDNNENN